MRFDCDATGKIYCLNGGSCPPDTDSCQCQPGYSGPHCENVEETSCTLECRNGGKCALSSLTIQTTKKRFPWPGVPPSAAMHCVCQPGYEGYQCEYQANVCGDYEHVCLHGSKCVLQKDKVSYGCECPRGKKNGCQHHKTEMCLPKTKTGISGLAPPVEYYGGMAIPAFCVNDGKCRDVRMGYEWYVHVANTMPFLQGDCLSLTCACCYSPFQQARRVRMSFLL